MQSNLIVEDFEDAMLEIALFGQENDGQLAHWGPGQRPFYILHYVLRGEGFFNGKPVHAGEGFLIEENSLHEYHSSEHDPWKYFYVVFRGTAVPKLMKEIPINADGIFTIHFTDRIRKMTRHLFSINGTITHYQALGYFYLLLSFHKDMPSPKETSARQHVNAAKRYLDLHYMQQVSIEETACSIPLNPRYLSRIFLAEEGISPKEYLNRLRIERACELLDRGSLSISQIAASVGFEDGFSFSRFFSSRVGMSPTAYRKQNQKLQTLSDFEGR